MLTMKDKYAWNRSPNDQHMVIVSRNGKTKTESKNLKHGGDWKGEKKGQGKKNQIRSTEQNQETNVFADKN